jgi:hypothetical protein
MIGMQYEMLEGKIFVVFTNINYREEMKYLKTIDLVEGENVITTTVNAEPYTVEFLDSDGNLIRTLIGQPKLTLVGDTYTVTVYTSEAIPNVKLKILY